MRAFVGAMIFCSAVHSSHAVDCGKSIENRAAEDVTYQQFWDAFTCVNQAIRQLQSVKQPGNAVQVQVLLSNATLEGTRKGEDTLFIKPFRYAGGRLLFLFTGSGYASEDGFIGWRVFVDGTERGRIEGYVNVYGGNAHHESVTGHFLVDQLPVGNDHVVTVKGSVKSTISDPGVDKFSLTVIEF